MAKFAAEQRTRKMLDENVEVVARKLSLNERDAIDAKERVQSLS